MFTLVVSGILDCLEDIIGDGVILHHTKVLSLRPLLAIEKKRDGSVHDLLLIFVK